MNPSLPHASKPDPGTRVGADLSFIAQKATVLGDPKEQDRLLEENHLLTKLRLLSQISQIASKERELPLLLSRSLRELERHLVLHTSSVWLAHCQKQPANGHHSEGEEDGFNPYLGEGSPVSWVLAANNRNSAVRAVALGLVPGRQLSTEQTPFSACLAPGQALYADLPRLRELSDDLCQELAARGASVYFAIPLHVGERTVGVLQSVATHTGGFTGEQIQLLYIVADLLGPAISNCQLVGRLRSAYKSLQASQDKLVQTEKMRALGELAAGVAHNFNNSLCGVLGFLEMALIDPALPASCRGLLEISRASALDAAQIVRRIQDFARRKEPDVAAQPVNLNDLIRQTVELTRPKWENAAVASPMPIEMLVLPEAMAEVIGNPGELREVLTNLIFNAVDAMPQGGTLTVRAWSTLQEVFLSVRDSGVGMSESVRLRLFEPMFTTKGQRGTGLGLSVSFGIVQRHHGEFMVESMPGQGSTFTVRMPVAVSPVGTKTEVVPLPPSHKALGRTRVLVIEDEDSIQRFLAIALTNLGYEPRLAASGEEGLTMFESEAIDIVLSDVGLPGINGEEVARIISARSPHIPVMLLTGWGDQLLAQGKLMKGVARVLTKPISIKTLAAALAEMSPEHH